MSDVHLAELAEQQGGNVGWAQLLALGWSPRQIETAATNGRLRPIAGMDGVYAVGHRPDTMRSRHFAATLTQPGTVLSHASLAAAFGARYDPRRFVTVTRSGNGGPVRHGALLVMRSTVLAGHTSELGGLPCTTAARCALDLAPHLSGEQLAKVVRELVRLGHLTAPQLHATLVAHRGRRGTVKLFELVERYERLQLNRTKSDAEAYALELLACDARPMPLVNVVHDGGEADLSWPDDRLIIELDGPQFHLFAEEDAIKQAGWEAAGWTVVRLSTDVVFDEPHRFLNVAPVGP